MQRLKQIWRGLLSFFRTLWEDLLFFWEDLQKEAYSHLVKVAAVALVALLVALLIRAVGGYELKRLWDELIEEDKHLVQRSLSGQVFDGRSDYPISAVEVGVFGQENAVTTTDAEGYFILFFKAHPDSLAVILSFSHTLYTPRTKRCDIPLSKEVASYKNDFVLYPRTPSVR